MYLLLPLLLLLLQHLIIRKKDPTTQTRLIVGPYAHGSSHHTNTHTHTFPSLSVPMDSLLFVCTNDEEKGEEIPQRERQDPKNVLFVTFFSLL